jgi:hypothetical protein
MRGASFRIERFYPLHSGCAHPARATALTGGDPIWGP